MQQIDKYGLMLILLLTLSACTGQNPGVPDEANSVKMHGTWADSYSPAPTDTLGIDDAPNVITRNIIQDRNGIIWFATFGGVIKYDGQAFTNVTQSFSSAPFFAALEDSAGTLWFGTVGAGIFKYDGQSWQNFTTRDGLADDRVTNIYEDKAGRLWFGTTGGISRYNGQSFQNLTTGQGINDNDVNDIIEDASGNYWIGTRGHAFIYDGTSFTKITIERGAFFMNVRHLLQDRHGNIWLGGSDGLWRYDGTRFLQITPAFTGYLYEDQLGDIWTSSENGNSPGWVLSRYDAALLDTEQPTATRVKPGEGMFFGILEDADGNIWVGTLNGVYRFDGITFTDFNG